MKKVPFRQQVGSIPVPEAVSGRGVCPEPYHSYWIKHGIGSHYVQQSILDNPPAVRSGLIPVPEALGIIGSSRWGEDWKDFERETRVFPWPVLRPRETLEDTLKGQERLAPKPPVKIPQSLSDPRPYDATREARENARIAQEKKRLEDWERGKPEREQRIREFIEQVQADHKAWQEGASASAEGVEMLQKAFKELVRAVGDSSVTPYYYRVSNGEVGEASADFMRVPGNVDDLIRASAIRDKGGSNVGYVFVDEGEVRNRFAMAGAPALEGVDTESLSAYLQLAIYVHGLGFGPEFTGTKKEIENALAEHAPKFGLELTPRLEQNLATFLRNPDAQAGKAKK